jgi:hypothetical protein
LLLAPFAYEDITLKSNSPEWRQKIGALKDEQTLHFKPHFGWTDRIEWKPVAAAEKQVANAA